MVKKAISLQLLVFVILFFVAGLIVFIPSASAQKKKKRKIGVEVGQAHIVLTNDDETSRYRIILPAAPTENESKAARILQDYLIRISGAVLPVITADKATSAYEIVLGQNERLDELDLGINLNDLKKDGFVIITDSLRLVIAGGSENGTLYGVYTLLEKYLGCRMYSPDVKVIPEQKMIVLEEIYDLQIPVMNIRTTHYRVTWDAEYIDWHKLNHNEQGGRPDWGMWVHTFHALVPPDVYFSEHPEYYSQVNGKRIPTQLCLTNPEVLKITIQNLRKKIAQNPEATYWSVSQNDNRDFCTCEKCRAIDEQEGSPSGSIINFVNQVAEQFPEKMISTLAYEYGRKAPRNLRPMENVNIMLCSIEIFRHKSIEDDPASADFMEDVVAWGKIAKDIIVWDYVIQFPNLISPFPNLHVLQPNIQFFVKNGVTSMFEQGNREVGGEFAELRAYLISKLLWNPGEDVEVLMNDFLNGYYGAAGPSIRRYIDEMRIAQLESGAPLRIFGSPNEADTSYLTPALLDRYEYLFDQAEAIVADSAELLERVRIARLPLEFAIMEQAKKKYTGERGLFHKVNGNWEVRTEIRSRIDPFTDLCVRQGVTRVKEWSTSPDEYRSSMYRLFAQGMKEHLAFGKKVTLISPDSLALAPGAVNMLTDGIRGGHDYAYNWLGFSGKNLEVIIDLEDVKQVRRIESAYFQYGYWLRLFPSNVEYFISMDGKKFVPVGNIENTLPIDQYGGQQRDFIAEFHPQPARYVKVIAHTIGNTPDWHPGAGRPANMLVDEIVVE
ncbi:MAG: DUF4838 domain-containing protein [Cyclobacteriaceae bacterium]|nr:DUF4838 domain-containing protein [Cyclobacteriaceae bacterium]